MNPGEKPRVVLDTNVHFLVSDDKAFRILKNLDFPKIEMVTLEEFMEVLEGVS